MEWPSIIARLLTLRPFGDLSDSQSGLPLCVHGAVPLTARLIDAITTDPVDRESQDHRHERKTLCQTGTQTKNLGTITLLHWQGDDILWLHCCVIYTNILLWYIGVKFYVKLIKRITFTEECYVTAYHNYISFRRCVSVEEAVLTLISAVQILY